MDHKQNNKAAYQICWTGNWILRRFARHLWLEYQIWVQDLVIIWVIPCTRICLGVPENVSGLYVGLFGKLNNYQSSTVSPWQHQAGTKVALNTTLHVVEQLSHTAVIFLKIANCVEADGLMAEAWVDKQETHIPPFLCRHWTQHHRRPFWHDSPTKAPCAFSLLSVSGSSHFHRAAPHAEEACLMRGLSQAWQVMSFI